MTWNPPPSVPEGPSPASRLVAVDVDAHEHKLLTRETADPKCDFAADRAPGRLPDGRLGFIRDCYEGFEEINKIVALDVETKAEEILASFDAPWLPDGRALVAAFSYRTGTSDGLLQIGDVLCGGVAAFDAQGARPFDFPLSTPAEGNLGDVFTQPCPDTVNALKPTWSPDGTRIALLVAPNARGVDGFGRFDATYSVALLDPSARTIEWLADNLDGAYRLTWSPDGKTVGVLTSDESGNETWLVSTRGGPLTRLVFAGAHQIDDIAWSPDGRRLAALMVTSAIQDLERVVQPVLIGLP